jgi:hypothetical protein
MLQRWRLRTKTRGVWNALVRAVRIRLLQLQPAERLASVLPLMVLATLSASCATPSQPSSAATNPQPPRLSEPLPSEPYSSKVQKLIESWLQRVTDM